MEGFGPFSEQTKDFSPARRARIEAIKARCARRSGVSLPLMQLRHKRGGSADEGPQRLVAEGH